MSIFNFFKEVTDVCASTDFIKDLDLLIFDEPVIKLRANITETTFIEIFFNSQTGKCSFASVKNKLRIYGMRPLKNSAHRHSEGAKRPKNLLNDQILRFAQNDTLRCRDFFRGLSIDNTKDWHIHPFENPCDYLPFHRISFREFIKRIEENKSKWSGQ